MRRARWNIYSIYITVQFAKFQHELTCQNVLGPENPVVDSDHDNDGAPEGHEGGEEGVGEVGVEHAQASVFTDC